MTSSTDQHLGLYLNTQVNHHAFLPAAQQHEVLFMRKLPEGLYKDFTGLPLPSLQARLSQPETLSQSGLKCTAS